MKDNNLNSNSLCSAKTTVPEQMSPTLEKFISEVEVDISNGKLSKKFNTAEEFLHDLQN